MENKYEMEFWKPGDKRPGSYMHDRVTENDINTLSYNNNINKPINTQRKLLPIYEHKNKLLYAIENYDVIIVVGETGSGKTMLAWTILNQLPFTKHELSGKIALNKQKLTFDTKNVKGNKISMKNIKLIYNY